MPLEPMDSMWMSKAPQVSDLVVQPDVTFKGVGGGSQPPASSMPMNIGDNDPIRPDFDTDCLWRPPQRPARIQKERTISMDSTDSETAGRKLSATDSITSPVDIQPRGRRISISEMLFGSSPNSFSWGMGSSPTTTNNELGDRRLSITDDPRFKDFMKHQSKIIGDDGISSSGFKRSNYVKE